MSGGSRMRFFAVVTVTALAGAFNLFGALNAHAEDAAVSGVNGKIGVEGGAYDGTGPFLTLGSVTVPLGERLGLQLDGSLGAIDDKVMWGGGAHLFTRDPSRYLFGLYVSDHQWNDINIWRAAAESEIYLGKFSLETLAGVENVDVPDVVDGLAVANEDDQHFFAHADIAFYPVDDLRLYGGYRFIAEESFGSAGAEYLFNGVGVPVSMYVDGRLGDEDHDQIMGGVRVYLGEDLGKSLIQRHRTEDPENYTPIFPRITVLPPTPPQPAPQSPAPPPAPPPPVCLANAESCDEGSSSCCSGLFCIHTGAGSTGYQCVPD